LNVNKGINKISDQMPIFNNKLTKVIEYGFLSIDLDRPIVTKVVKINPKTPQRAPYKYETPHGSAANPAMITRIPPITLKR
jgi:hypothetical protein